MGDDTAPTGKSRRLSDVVREVKIAAAEREDVVVDMREADRARIDLLAEELAPVFEQVPAEDDQFDFVISAGLQPRLWIDAIAHVQMGPDRRTYRFVRDTRHGRVVMAESSDMMRIADSITHYVAERMVERRRFLANEERAPELYGAPLSNRAAPRQTSRAPVAEPARTAPAETRRAAPPKPTSTSSRVPGYLWFLLGAICGAAALALVYRDQIGPLLG